MASGAGLILRISAQGGPSSLFVKIDPSSTVFSTFDKDKLQDLRASDFKGFFALERTHSNK